MWISSVTLSIAQAADRIRNAVPVARITPFEVDGSRYWLKQLEKDLNWRKRFTKGTSQATLDLERNTLKSLAKRGVPVPAIVYEGPDFLVLADCGPTLEDIVLAPGYRREDGLIAFAAAGRALAELHGQGLGHGRGKIKDFCWDGSRISFIDFETFVVDTAGGKSIRKELVAFVFHGYLVAVQNGIDLSAEIAAGVASYRAHGREEVWRASCDWVWNRRWAVAVARPVNWLRPGRRAPDFKAIAPTLAVFCGTRQT